METDFETSVPRSLASEQARVDRTSALNEPHVAALTNFVLSLRARDDREYPYFDPADGGVNASMLFLFEKPGPMTVQRGKPGRVGSGFISRDNDDPTAEATFEFQREAGIARRETVLWNAIPGWNGTRKITSDEWAEGIRDLSTLIPLLPRLRAIVLVGRKAWRAQAELERSQEAPIFKSAHPSPLVRGAYRCQWDAIPGVWKEAARAAGIWQVP